VVLGLLGTELGVCDFRDEIEMLYEGYREDLLGRQGKTDIEWMDYDFESGDVCFFFGLKYSWWGTLEG
jgi:hypothetical protein